MGLIRNLIIFGLVVFFFAVIIVSFDLGYTGNIVRENFNTRYAVEHTDEIVNEYNHRFERIPNFAKTLLGNERINLIINMNDGSMKEYSLVTQEGKIIEYDNKLLNDYSIAVRTSERVIDSIASSKEPGNDFGNAVENGDIKIESQKLVSGIKITTAKIFVKIKNWF